MGPYASTLHVFFPHASPVYVEKTAFGRVMKTFLKTNLGCCNMFFGYTFCIFTTLQGALRYVFPESLGIDPWKNQVGLLTVEGGKDLRK